VCAGACTATTSSVSNCGACGNVCPVGNRCIAGRCFEGGTPPTQEGDVRLVGGTSASNGILEIFAGGAWGAVCDDSDVNPIGTVVCRQLGFSSSVATCCQTASASAFRLDDVICGGSEPNLLSCSYRMPIGAHNCSNGEYIRINCM
jgi:hypothetical protein